MISKSSVGMDIDKIVIPQDEPQNITLNELPTLDQYTKVSVNIKVLKVHSPVEVGSDKKKKQTFMLLTKQLLQLLYFGKSILGHYKKNNRTT